MVSALHSLFRIWRPKKMMARPEKVNMNALSKPELLTDSKDSIGDFQILPLARSGHRCFCTGDHFYVVGGYNPSYRGKMINDVWCLNLLTRRWKRVKLDKELPHTLASFSLSYVDELGTFYLYGGTGFPFGQTISTDLYACTLVKPDECSVRKIPIDNPKSAPVVYGHSAVHRYINGNFTEVYIVGGTEGAHYDMTVTKLTIFEDHARFERVSTPENEPNGRYRHESVFIGNTIVSLGGSNQLVAIPMKRLDAFDIRTLEYSKITTKPDPRWRFPRARKGHSVVQSGNFAILFGGFDPPATEHSDGELLSDVWCLDLRSLEWKRSNFQLPWGVFFHSAAVNQLNQVVSFGGCAQVASKRVDDTIGFHIAPPPLSYLAARVYLNFLPTTSDQSNVSYSTIIRLAQDALSPKLTAA
uniref:Kelch domain-containing protein 10 n=1 Tax=Bursaphelenchus xylophilus TaxID=6326 RepID=A0A1I7SWR2_BURXY